MSMDPRSRTIVTEAAFALECAAHLRGLEASLLPHAQALRLAAQERTVGDANSNPKTADDVALTMIADFVSAEKLLVEANNYFTLHASTSGMTEEHYDELVYKLRAFI